MLKENQTLVNPNIKNLQTCLFREMALPGISSMSAVQDKAAIGKKVNTI